MTAESGATDIARMLLDAGGDPDIHDDKYDATVLAGRNSAARSKSPSSSASEVDASEGARRAGRDVKSSALR